MLTAVLASTTLDAASGQLTCAVRISLGGNTNDFNPVISAERLGSTANGANWGMDDVLSLLSEDCGFPVTVAAAQ